uniref:Polycystic kidney disease 1 like 2a n=1 Tax=Esox lucius TaxID=8010 RepID=A0A6Q2YTG2_ESOLU
MDNNILSLLGLIAFLLSLSTPEHGVLVLSCPEYQEGFDGSCYEFVVIQRTFLSAQSWCERGGGHLAFILNDETQQFLQKHLQPEKDWWLGLAPASVSLKLDFAAEGPLSWLDGSDISYSNWLNDPVPGARCAHILRNSGFQWEATDNCSQQLHFICQFGVCVCVCVCLCVCVCVEKAPSIQSSHIHLCLWSTGQKTIIIHEPIGEFGVLKCYSMNQSTDARNCKALYGSPFQIQVEVEAGTNVTYEIHSGKMLVASSSANRGNISHNITVGPDVELQLGSGCHQLTLHASNGVSVLGKSIELQVCLLEPVEGLLASLMAECSKADLYISVSLERGAPVQLLFQVSGTNDSLSETRDMQTTSMQVHHISTTIQGTKSIQSSLPINPNQTLKQCVYMDYRKSLFIFLFEFNSMFLFSFSCVDNCKAVDIKKDVILQLDCKTKCPQVIWNIEDPIPFKVSLRYFSMLNSIQMFYCLCYLSVGKKTFEYAKYTIQIPGATKPPPANTKPTVTTAPAVTLSPPSCSILPLKGTVLDPFNVTCSTPASCQNGIDCQYCFKTDHGDSRTPIQALQSTVEDTVAILEQQVTLSGEALGQLFQSVCDMLNEALENTSSSLTPQTVQVTARAVAGLTSKGDELSANSQLQASVLVVNLSSSLLSMNVSEDGGEVMMDAATQIVEAVSNILNVFCLSQKEVSQLLFMSMDNVQSALLKGRKVDEAPVIVSSAQIISPKMIQMQSINIPDSSSASFSFPPLDADVLPPDKPVDVRMQSLKNNPFSWNEEKDISGTVGSVSLTRENGSIIPIENLSEEIEVLLPRPEGELANSTIMYLGNHSTLKVDIPSSDVTLVLKIEPSRDMPFQLFLGYKYYPNNKQYIAKTQMPLQSNTQEERYTWVLGPSELSGNVGVHYVVLIPIVNPGIQSVNATVTVISIVAQCKYWDETKYTWKQDGCKVGPITSSLVTQCLCNHLTFFGSSFFVMPNLVDVSRSAQLFSTFAKNPVVVCFVGAIFIAYLLVVMWARRKDIHDTIKVKVTVLEDNDPLAEYRYMLNVSTGHRRGASTSSQVTVILLGTEGESEPHHLTDPDKPVFERGTVDTFLLTTPFSLGELLSIRLWHDNSGGHPAWYINKILVQDVETGKKWHFLCNSWLAISMNECTLDKVFHVATETELRTFSNLFFMRMARDFCDGHIWFSVISRPPTSTFTCVQRVSCCFSLLLCTMLTNIMFWGIPTNPSEQTMDLGHIEITWQHVMIGIQSSILTFPINLIIVSIFRSTRPQKKPEKSTRVSKQGKNGNKSSSQAPSPKWDRELMVDTVVKDLKKIVQSLSKAMKRPVPWQELEFSPGKQTDINSLLSLVEETIWQQYRDGRLPLRKELSHLPTRENSVSESPEKTMDGSRKLSLNSQFLYKQLRHLEKQLHLLGPSHFPNQDCYHRAVEQLQGMNGLLEPFSIGGDLLVRSNGDPETSNGDSGRKKCCQGGLPWWFVIIGWILVLATSGVSGYFTMIYGLTYGKDRSISWLISMVVSFFQSLFLTQPLKVLGFAAFFALVLKKVDQEEYGDPQIKEALRNPDDPDAVQASRRDSTCSFYQPPPPSDIERMKNNMIKEQKVFDIIKEIIAYMGFMWMLLLVAYSQRDTNAFFLNQHIRQSFSQGISDSMTLSDVFTWANTSLLSNLFGVYPGFITDGNSKLVGNAHLRQVRVQKNSCGVAHSMRQAVPDCNAPYSWEVEDMGSYGPGWNRSVSVNTSKTLRSPWQYQTQASLRALPIWGSVVLYRGGGFVVELGPDSQNASSTLQYLFDSTWLDMFTRAVFVEFTVYNANVNLFCIVTLMLETAAVGAFQFRSDLQSVQLYQSTGGLSFCLMASGVIYFLYILYYMYVQGKLMKRQRWAYFKTKQNMLELAIILLSWSALSVFIKRALLGNRDMEYYQNHKDQFASFQDTANADATLGYLIAFLVLLATIKLWNLLRLNPKLHMMTAVIQRAWTDLSGLILIMIIMLLAYSIACNLMYGWKLYSYRTLLDATMTMVSLQVGIFNFDEVLDYNPVLAAFLIGSCIIFMTFVVLTLFVAVVMGAFGEERKHHKPSDEEEIVDLMLMKLYSLFGMKIKKEEKIH